MQCNEFRDHIFDFLSENPSQSGGEAQKHLSACSACTAEIDSLKSTMSLLDEWKVPEDTSPYFMTRLRARVREERQKEASRGWMAWFRKPAVAVGTLALLLVSVSLYQGRGSRSKNEGQVAIAQQGNVNVSLVTDLQYLDKDEELLADFELLDDAQEFSVEQIN